MARTIIPFGPTLRASGVAQDMRQLGYAAFKDLQVEPIIRKEGGQTLEPFETLWIELPAEYIGHWLLVYFVLTMGMAWALKGPFRVEI